MTNTPIFVVGVPRSGNQWLCRLLGDVLDSPVASGLSNPSNADEGENRRGPYVIRLRHPSQMNDVILEGKAIIRLYRDPRDVALSTREYWDSDWPTAISRTKRHHEQMDGFPEVGLETRYESLLSFGEWEIGRILNRMSIKTNWARIRDAVLRQAYDVRRSTLTDSMPYSKAHQIRAIGHGKSGRWKVEVPASVLQNIHDALWHWINGLGYESNPEWWKNEMV